MIDQPIVSPQAVPPSTPGDQQSPQPVPAATQPTEQVVSEQPVTDPAVEQLVQQAQDLQQTFQQNDHAQSTQAVPTEESGSLVSDVQSQAEVQPVPDITSSPSIPQNEAQQTVPTDLSATPTVGVQPIPVPAQPETTSEELVEAPPAGGKSPLDILEEILGKSEGVEPSEPEKSPEEIEAERQAHLAQQQAMIEQQRQQLHAEVSSQEQQQRDAIRNEQLQEHQQANEQDIYQIKREKITE